MLKGPIIERVFAYGLITTIIVALGIVAILVFMILRKSQKKYYFLWTALSVVLLALSSVRLVLIRLDVSAGDFVTYEGVYEDRSAGNNVIQTIAVYNEGGKEIRLAKTGSKKRGKYKGLVIYGKRSRVVVEYGGVIIDED